MNIEIANRLVELRKQKNYSQEVLAEKLGISRQAVSKWERAEASPDTDNLILLSRLYGVSLDELLKTEDEIPVREPAAGAGESTRTAEEDPEYVHVGLNGIHVREKGGKEVRVGWSGIHVDDPAGGEEVESVHIDKKGVFINGEKYDKKNWIQKYRHFPV